MIIVQGKIWGKTSCLFHKNNVEIHRIEVKNNGYCSKHKHEHKFNLFFIEEGELEITIYRTDANTSIEDVTTLTDGESTYVEPGLYHKFMAKRDSIAYEIYWVELDPADIIREARGGRAIVTDSQDE